MRRVGVLAAFLVLPLACGHSAKPGHVRLGKATPSRSAAPVTGPGFHLPADVKVVVDYDRTGDPVKDKMLSDLGNVMTALVQAKYDANPDEPLLLRYATGRALDSMQAQVRLFKRPAGLIGSLREYNIQIISVKDGYSELTGCEDESQWFDRDPGTNRPVPHASGYQAFTSYTVGMKLDSGTWKANVVEGKQVASC